MSTAERLRRSARAICVPAIDREQSTGHEERTGRQPADHSYPASPPHPCGRRDRPGPLRTSYGLAPHRRRRPEELGDSGPAGTQGRGLLPSTATGYNAPPATDLLTMIRYRANITTPQYIALYVRYTHNNDGR